MIKLAYHDYAMLVTFLDQSAAIRLRHEKPADADSTRQQPCFAEAVAFTRACCAFRERLERRCSGFSTASGRAHPKLPDRFLYNPACFLAFGHADSFGLVAVDAFDPIVSITMDLESPVERHSVAFLPMISSLGLPQNVERLFATLEQWLVGNAHGSSSEVPPELTSSDAKLLISHPFQDELPLAVLSLFKIGGIATLGAGLQLRRATMRAIALRVAAVVDAISHIPDNNGPRILTASDSNWVQCLLFEPQDGADLGLVVATRNFSLGAAIVAAIDQLTIADLIVADPSLELVLNTSQAHQTLAECCRLTPDHATTELLPASLFSHNHVLSSAYSTLGVAPKAFVDPFARDEEGGKIRGYMSVTVRFDVNPGHLGIVEQRVRDAVADTICKFGSDMSVIAPKLGTRRLDSSTRRPTVHEFLVGRHDYQYIPGALRRDDLGISSGQTRRSDHSNTDDPAYGLETSAFLFSIQLLLREFGIPVPNPDVPLYISAEASKAPSLARTDETGLIDINSAVSLPLPELVFDRFPATTDSRLLARLGFQDNDATGISDRLFPSQVGDRHQPLLAALAHLRAQLLVPDRKSNVENQRLPQPGLRIDRQLLRQSMTRLGLPKSVRRAIHYLFQDFLKCLDDPFQFDAVLDLLDVFLGLSHILQRLGAAESLAKWDSFQRWAFSHDAIVDGYSHLTTSLMHAMMHRIGDPGPRGESWDRAVDVRGGLNKFIAAAEAPWKCGLAFLRRSMTSDGSRLTPRSCSQVGGVVYLSLSPSIVCRQPQLWPECNRSRVGAE